MKNLLLLLAFILTAAACGTNNGSGEENKVEKWTMISYVAFMPSIPELEEGDIIWTMDSKDNSLLVESQINEVWGLAPGAYTYEFVTAEAEGIDGEVVKQNLIVIGGNDSYLYRQDGPTMVLNSNTDPRLSGDAPVMTFKRMTE